MYDDTDNPMVGDESRPGDAVRLGHSRMWRVEFAGMARVWAESAEDAEEEVRQLSIDGIALDVEIEEIYPDKGD